MGPAQAQASAGVSVEACREVVGEGCAACYRGVVHPLCESEALSGQLVCAAPQGVAPLCSLVERVSCVPEVDAVGVELRARIGSTRFCTLYVATGLGDRFACSGDVLVFAGQLVEGGRVKRCQDRGGETAKCARCGVICEHGGQACPDVVATAQHTRKLELCGFEAAREGVRRSPCLDIGHRQAHDILLEPRDPAFVLGDVAGCAFVFVGERGAFGLEPRCLGAKLGDGVGARGAPVPGGAVGGVLLQLWLALGVDDAEQAAGLGIGALGQQGGFGHRAHAGGEVAGQVAHQAHLKRIAGNAREGSRQVGGPGIDNVAGVAWSDEAAHRRLCGAANLDESVGRRTGQNKPKRQGREGRRQSSLPAVGWLVKSQPTARALWSETGRCR